MVSVSGMKITHHPNASKSETGFQWDRCIQESAIIGYTGSFVPVSLMDLSSKLESAVK